MMHSAEAPISPFSHSFNIRHSDFVIFASLNSQQSTNNLCTNG